jgi:hypothetical protein
MIELNALILLLAGCEDAESLAAEYGCPTHPEYRKIEEMAIRFRNAGDSRPLSEQLTAKADALTREAKQMQGKVMFYGEPPWISLLAEAAMLRSAALAALKDEQRTV